MNQRWYGTPRALDRQQSHATAGARRGCRRRAQSDLVGRTESRWISSRGCPIALLECLSQNEVTAPIVDA